MSKIKIIKIILEMPVKSSERKIQERHHRDLLILSVARSLLAEQGVEGLSMQAIANSTDYSKGTIYQHYHCKEDVITKLVSLSGIKLVAMIDEALKQGKSLRHKIMLISAVFFMNARQQPEISSLVSMVKSPQFQGKISAENKVLIAELDHAILSRIMNLFVEDTGFNCQQVKDAAFGWWSMKWGVQNVLLNEWETETLGFTEPLEFFFRSLNVFLNGFGVADDENCQSWSQIQAQGQSIVSQFVVVQK
jgi:AcrR family transcriptional regulator